MPPIDSNIDALPINNATLVSFVPDSEIISNSSSPKTITILSNVPLNPVNSESNSFGTKDSRLLCSTSKPVMNDLAGDDIEDIIEPFEDSSDEYHPSCSDQSDDSELALSRVSKKPAERRIVKDDDSIANNTDCIEYTHNVPETPEEDNADDNVLHMPILSLATVSGIRGKRVWDKMYFCTFCKKHFMKLPRHWYKQHAQELEVAKIMSLPITSIERKKLISILQNRGHFVNNTNAMRSGKGKIVTKRRARTDNDVTEYLPCEYCFQFFKKTYLARHQKKVCAFRHDATENDNKRKNKSIRAANLMMLPIGPEVSLRFRDCILSKMSGDDICVAVRSDQLIIKYGESEFQRMGHDERYHRTIIDRCRELGRLILAAKELDPNITKLIQLLNANQYQLLKNSVMKVSGFNELNNTFQAPSLALKLGMTVKKCALILKGDFLEDDILKHNVPQLEDFLTVMNAKWSREIATHALRTLSEKKWNNPKRLPLARDIQSLHKYLKAQSDHYSQILEKEPNANAFEILTEVSLVTIIILNRRRVGEVQYMPLYDYEKAKSCDSESDVFNTLSDAEKELSKTLIRLVIKGKRGRSVPVLLTENLQNNIALLIKRRQACGVTLDNKYLFASLRHSSGFYQAHRLLNKFAKEAGCQSSETITSTRLGKHVAVMVQLLNLREHELDSLAQFMGHDIRVHRQYYRLADETMQLAKISKVLINMEKGNVNMMKGKNL